MPVVFCHRCTVPLTRDDRLHYVVECHACVIREHDLWHAVRRDPDHPDRGRLGDGPAEFAPARPRARMPSPARPGRRRIAPLRARG